MYTPLKFGSIYKFNFYVLNPNKKLFLRKTKKMHKIIVKLEMVITQEVHVIQKTNKSYKSMASIDVSPTMAMEDNINKLLKEVEKAKGKIRLLMITS